MKVSLLFLLLISFSCSYVEELRPLASNIPAPEKKAFRQAKSLLDEKRYLMAKEKFDAFIKQYPASLLSVSAVFQLAKAYEGLEDFQNAAKHYRNAAELWAGKKPKDRVQALYRLSICYERLAEDDKMLGALLAVSKDEVYLKRNVRDIELPARLAIGYARVGNVERSKSYFELAKFNLKKFLKRQDKESSKEWIAKTLYSIGEMSLRASESRSFEDHLRALNASQTYLLRSLEYDLSPWSENSQNLLQSNYKTLFSKLIAKNSRHPKDTSDRQQMDKNKVNARKLSTALEQAILEFSPIYINKPSVKAFESFATALDKDIQRLYLFEPGETLTPEAQKLQSLSRPGRVYDKTGRVEKITPQKTRKLPNKKNEKK